MPRKTRSVLRSRICAAPPHGLRGFVVILTLLFILSGCASAPPNYNPFHIGKENFYQLVKIVALVPIKGANNIFIDSPEKMEAFDILIEDKLRDGGFTVIPKEEFETKWYKKVERVGGLYDPTTGVLDESKEEEISSEIRNELFDEFNADVLVYAYIGTVQASFINNIAGWHGVYQLVSGSNKRVRKRTRLWSGMVFGSYDGEIPALSLFVEVVDASTGKTLYKHPAGIQVIKRLKAEFYDSPMLIDFPQDKLLDNEEFNRAAVNMALDPLIAGLKGDNEE